MFVVQPNFVNQCFGCCFPFSTRWATEIGVSAEAATRTILGTGYGPDALNYEERLETAVLGQAE